MKVFIVLATFVVVASAGRASYGGSSYGGPSYGAGYTSGQSTQFRQEDNYGNYNFGYDESHATGGSSRREEQQNGVRRGSYSLTDADGRQRTVNYVADGYGFRATVHTNEPGVEPKDPADVLINKDGGYGGASYAAPAPAAYAAPAPAYAAPAPVAVVKSYAAPVATKSYAAPAAYAAPAPAYSAPAYAQPAYEAPAPRAFSYSFGATHAAPAYSAPATYSAPAAYSAPAPVYHERAAAY